MTQPSPVTTDPDLLLRYTKSLDCVHCGLCLPHCPTYRETRDESASPRGRIYLMRGLAEGRLSVTPSFAEKMDLCLVCRNCETVCPSGVEFGRMMELTRDEIESNSGRFGPGKVLRRFILNRMIPHPRRMARMATILRFYRKSGLASLVRVSRLNRIFPRTLMAMEANLPDVPPASERLPLPEFSPAAAGIPRRGRVALLEGCVMPQLFGTIQRATIRALQAQGYDVLVPRLQTCCGALHAHSGDLTAAKALARRNIESFLAVRPDYIVLNSAGCGAALKDYDHWFHDEPEWLGKAREVSAKVIDVLDLFHREHLNVPGRLVPRRVRAVYDAPCHLRHAQKCAVGPLEILKQVPEIELVHLPGADDCCGAAGIYNIQQPEMSEAILKRKLDQLETTKAEILITGNPGCMLQWQRGIRERKLKIRVVHPVEFLAP